MLHEQKWQPCAEQIPLQKMLTPVHLSDSGGGGLATKLYPTLATQWSTARQAPLSMGFPRQEYWSGLPFPSPGNFPNSGIELGSPAVQAESLLTEPSGNQTVQGWDFMDALLNRKEAEAQRRKVMCLSALSKSATEFKWKSRNRVHSPFQYLGTWGLQCFLISDDRW